nr:recombinase family protein [Apilactobacillus micheneri]
MKYGYARVSTTAQSLKDQMELLKNAGIENKNVYHEKYTGIKTNRPVFNKLLKVIKANDTLVVTKLDRLARNTREALNVIHDLQEKGVTIKVLSPKMTVSNDIGGKIMYNTLLMVADLERDMIVERTKAGKEYAKLHNPNYKEGRKPRLEGKYRDFYRAVYEYKKKHSAQDTAEYFTSIGKKISVRTVFRINKMFKELEQ